MIWKRISFFALFCFVCSPAFADLSGVTPEFAGSVYVGSNGQTLTNGTYHSPGETVSGPTVVYDNLAAPSAVSTGLANQGLGQTFGDRVTIADTGYFDAISLSIFNVDGIAGNLIETATLNVGIYDANTFDETDLSNNTALFSTSAALDFTGFGAGGLDNGFFTIVTLGDLFATNGAAATGFTLTNTDLMFTQNLSNITGASQGNTFVTFTTDNVGTQFGGNDNFWGTPWNGYVGFGPPTSNRIASQIVLTIPEPGTCSLLAIATIGMIARRRR